MSKLRWQDVVNLLMGLWIASSPWVLGYSSEYSLAMWSGLIVGGAILVIASIDLDMPARWEEWTLVALGIWVAVSPLVLAFGSSRIATLNSVASGIVVAALAGWALVAAHGWRRHDDHATSH
jgi:uncharacterized membrane protein AbrB (regulator of aidB expression)